MARAAVGLPDLTRDVSQEFEFSVAPGVASTIVLGAPPGALCHIGPPDEDKLTIAADSAGIARFRTASSSPAGHLRTLAVDCEADGRVTSHTLMLRTAHEPTENAPSPPQLNPLAEPRGHLREPLSHDELLSLSDQELHARGFPPRPNPDEVPGAFAAWVRAARLPAVRADPGHVTMPGSTAGPLMDAITIASSANWSAFEMVPTKPFVPTDRGLPKGPYDRIMGIWHHPFVPLDDTWPTGFRDIAVWVGLDGDVPLVLTKNLYQAGTYTKIHTYGAADLRHHDWSVQAWTELVWAHGRGMSFLTEVPVEETDHVQCVVWIGDDNGVASLDGDWGWAHIHNLSKGILSMRVTKLERGMIRGRTAEWVVERTLQGPGTTGPFAPLPSLNELAPYGHVLLRAAMARLADAPLNKGFVTYLEGLNKRVNMHDDDFRIVSTVVPYDGDSMLFRYGKGQNVFSNEVNMGLLGY